MLVKFRLKPVTTVLLSSVWPFAWSKSAPSFSLPPDYWNPNGFWKENKCKSVVTNIPILDIEMCSFVTKYILLYEPYLATVWFTTWTLTPCCYCVACLFNPTSVSVRKVGNLHAASALNIKCWSRVAHSHIASPPFLLLSHFWLCEVLVGEL